MASLACCCLGAPLEQLPPAGLCLAWCHELGSIEGLIVVPGLQFLFQTGGGIKVGLYRCLSSVWLSFRSLLSDGPGGFGFGCRGFPLPCAHQEANLYHAEALGRPAGLFTYF